MSADQPSIPLRSLHDPAPVTVDAVLRNPARLAAVIAAQVEKRLAFDALFPPPPPLTGWKLARQQVGDRVSNARTWLALRVAPWLSSGEEF